MPRISHLSRRIRKLPVDSKGYYVPRFVQRFDNRALRAHGVDVPDFQVIDAAFFDEAAERRLCWICGEKLSADLAFIVAAVVAVTRIAFEPPCHRDCATFAAQHCPFLALQLCAVWITRDSKRMQIVGDAPATLFRIGEPSEVLWFNESRRATRSEVEAALVSGLPSLNLDSTAQRRLRDLYELIPSEAA